MTDQTNTDKYKRALLACLRKVDIDSLTPWDQPGVVYGVLENEVKKFNKACGSDFDPASIIREYLGKN